MSFHPTAPRATPARLTAPAAAKLSRTVLLSVCLVYIVFGLFLRDPWKSDDVIGMAQMWSAVHFDPQAWLLPQVAGVTAAHNGPLAMWAGALSMQWLGPWLGDVLAGRLPNVLWFAVTTASLWYGTYLLGRRPEAQPLALPFGGQPLAADYGRMLADAALLLLIGTLGLAWPSHETSAVPAGLACQALAFYALARMLDRPWLGAATLGIALAGAFLARGGATLLPVLAALPVILIAWPRRARLAALVLALPLAAGLILMWWLPAMRASAYWMNGWATWHLDFFGIITWQGAASVLRNAPWFLWPLWPLAAVALWRWRGWYHAPHLLLPATLGAAATLMLLLVAHPGEAELLTLIIPAATLGALALPTLRRGQINSLDWFAVMAFSVAAALVWFGWATALTGWPAKIADNIERQTPGFELTIVWWATAIAIAATAGWVALLIWRLRTQPASLWRGSMLSAAGVLLSWVLLNTLWIPSIDYARSYRPVAAAIRAAIPAGTDLSCVGSRNLGLAQRAAFAVQAGLTFGFRDDCPLILQQTTQRLRHIAPPPGVSILWEGTRPADRNEYYRLLQIQP